MTQYTMTSDSLLRISINDTTYTYYYADFDPTRIVPYRFNIGEAPSDSSVPLDVYIFDPGVWNDDWTVASAYGLGTYKSDGTFIQVCTDHYIKKYHHGVVTLGEAINLQCFDDPPRSGLSGYIGVPGHADLDECPKSTVLTDSRISGGCGIELIEDYNPDQVVNYDDIKVKVVYNGMTIVPDTSELKRSGTSASLPTPSNIPSNYTFGGWSTTPGGSRVYQVTIKEFTELYAIWTLNDDSPNRAIYSTTSSGNTLGDIQSGGLSDFKVNFTIQQGWQKYITVGSDSLLQNKRRWTISGLPANCTYTINQSSGTIAFRTYDGRTIMTVFNPSSGGYTYNGAIGENTSIRAHIYHMTENNTYSARFETVDLDGNPINGVVQYTNHSSYSTTTQTNGITVLELPKTCQYVYSKNSSTTTDHIFNLVDASGSQVGYMDALITNANYRYVRYEQSSLGQGNISIKMVLTPNGSAGSNGWPSDTTKWIKFRISYIWSGYQYYDSGAVNYRILGDATHYVIEPAYSNDTLDTAVGENVLDDGVNTEVLEFDYMATGHITYAHNIVEVHPSSIKTYILVPGGPEIHATTTPESSGVSITITAADINNALVDSNQKFFEYMCNGEGSGTQSDPYVAHIYLDIT